MIIRKSTRETVALMNQIFHNHMTLQTLFQILYEFNFIVRQVCSSKPWMCSIIKIKTPLK
jgi:hypothetical protein